MPEPEPAVTESEPLIIPGLELGERVPIVVEAFAIQRRHGCPAWPAARARRGA
jgi:hypothetical protein